MKTKTQEQKREEQRERRKFLITLSKTMRPLIESGAYDTVNQALLGYYSSKNENIEEFNTFHQWKEKGKTILKGEKAFLIWGQPRKTEQTDNPEEKETRFWPVCYLFANTQVN